MERPPELQSISLKLPPDMLAEATENASELNIPRSEYIRRALEQMNRERMLAKRRERLADVSRRACGESMRVNAEFSEIDSIPDA